MKHILSNNKFKGDVSNLIEVGDFSIQKRKQTQNYGELVMTKVVTVKLLGSLRAGKLTEVNGFYSKLRSNLGFFYLEPLESEFISNQNISNFEIFTPLKEHNPKVSAVYQTEKKVRELMNKIIYKNNLEEYVTYL